MHTEYNLNDLGWNDELEKQFEELKYSYDVGRVAAQYKGLYRLYCNHREIFAAPSGRMIGLAETQGDYPAVGDWVIIDKVGSDDDRAVIRGILKRKSKFSRKCAGNRIEEQIVAVNIDTIFITMSLNQNYNIRRLERYITMAWESGAAPVVLLTKSDLCQNVYDRLEETERVAIGIDVYSVSSITGLGINEIKRYIKPGKTVTFIGSSGVGKSTIINKLLGEERLCTKEISSFGDRGKHTTTNRELIVLPNGGIVIDTPGMRELHILDADEGISTAFDDIESISSNCKFSDCTHTVEPKCAIKEAIRDGILSEDRYKNYIKMKKEAEYFERKTNKKTGVSYKNSIRKR